MELRFSPLFSGSSGNSVFVSYGGTNILIDAGVSCRRIENELRLVNVEPDSISSVLITHEHSDHIKGVPVFSRKYGCEVYATGGTWAAMRAKQAIAAEFEREIAPDEDFFIGELNILPFSTPHDAADSVGYVITAPTGAKLAIATDMGYAKKSCVSAIMGAHAVILEFNYDEGMLMAGKYPYELKRRIKSRSGHLSNDDGALLAAELVKGGAACVVLSHLSKENNMPELALQRCRMELDASSLSAKLVVAKRDGNSGMFTVSSGWGDDI